MNIVYIIQTLKDIIMMLETAAQNKTILLLCGTAETSRLANDICQLGFSVLLSTATDAYLNIDSIVKSELIKRREGKLDLDGFVQLINKEDIIAIVNACHPYAADLRNTVNSAAEITGVPCLNYTRSEVINSITQNWITCSTHDEAAKAAFSYGKPVLLTTGSNNLSSYVKAARNNKIPVIARVLPRIESLNACIQAGLLDHEIIAARGPFTVDENTAVINRYRIGTLITKSSGREGGFTEKIEAAKQTNCTFIIVRRPQSREFPNTFSDLDLFHDSFLTMINSLNTKNCININTQKSLDNFTSNYKHGGNLGELAKESGLTCNQIIDFSANINPLGPISDIHNILSNAFHEITRYPDPENLLLKQAISTFGEWNIDMIVPANGASELLYAAAAIGKGNRALIPVPSYNDYADAAKRACLHISYLNFSEENSFLLDTTLLSDSIHKNDLIFIGRPNNPTGNCISVEELRFLIEHHQDAFFIIDESFIEFSPNHLSIAQSLPVNCIMIRSMTKFYALPGLRLGYAVAHPQIAAKISQMLTPWSVNCLAHAAGIASLKNAHYQSKSRTLMNDLRIRFTKALSQFPFLKVYPSEANFLLIKVYEPFSGDILFSKLIKRGLGVRKCANFIGLDNNYIRIAIRTNDENSRLIDALHTIWSKECHAT